MVGCMYMNIRVNEISQTSQPDGQRQVSQTDGNFKFVLASNIEEKDLQAKICLLWQILP